MDYQRFIEQLPHHYKNWGSENVQPQSNDFQTILSNLKGMTTPNVMQLLNFAVRCMAPGEVYCEVGCFQGATLVGALHQQSDHRAYAVDNFSEFDSQGTGLQTLLSNLARYRLSDRVLLRNQNFEDFFHDLDHSETHNNIGVYLYDGAHDYRSQFMGLLLAKPFLADQALIIVDDTNWSSVKQANWDFIASHPPCKMVFDLPTPYNGHPSFWNGIQVMVWDINSPEPCSREVLYSNRDQELIDAIYKLHFEFENQKLRAIASPYHRSLDAI